MASQMQQAWLFDNKILASIHHHYNNVVEKKEISLINSLKYANNKP